MKAKMGDTSLELRAGGGHHSQRPGSGPQAQRPASAGLYGALYVLLETFVQMAVFAYRHFNPSKRFPFSPTSLVATAELIKFALCLLAFCGCHGRLRFLPAPAFALPAALFVAAANLSYYCMYFVPPPTVNVLAGWRVAFSAAAGYVVFGRPLGRRLWMAAGPLLLASALAVWFCPEVEPVRPLDSAAAAASKDGANSTTVRTLWWIAAVLAGVACSTFSVSSAEFISKVSNRSVSEKYVQLHFFTTILGFIWAEIVTGGSLYEINMKMFFPLDFYLTVLNLITGTLGSLALTHLMAGRLSQPVASTVAAAKAATGVGIESPAAAWSVAPWIPALLFLSTSAVCPWLFPVQPGYHPSVTAAVALLMGSAAYLYSAPSLPASPEPARPGLKQEA